VNRFKMNQAKTALKRMLEEYGARGKLRAEKERARSENAILCPQVTHAPDPLPAKEDQFAL
jgi:hypothetical protein